jgi:hypothetical protein
MLFSIFFSYENENTKKRELSMEFPMTLWPKWLLHNILPPMLCSQIPLLYTLLNYGKSTMLKEWNPSPPNGPIFNII